MKKWQQTALATIGLTFLWTYLQHFFFRVTLFDNITTFDSLIGFGFFLVILAIGIAFAALWQEHVERFLQKPLRVLVLTSLTLVSNALITFLPEGTGADPFVAVLMFVCVGMYGVGFIAVFLAWALELKQLVFKRDLSTAIAIVVASAALGYAISPTWIVDTWFYRLIPVYGVALSGLCRYLLCRKQAFEGEGANATLRSPSVRRWGLLFAAYFIISIMHAILYYVDREADFSADTPLSFAALFLFMAFLFLMATNRRGRLLRVSQESLWYVGIVLMVVLFAGLFFTFQIGSTDAVTGMSIVFTIMRCLQLFVFVIILVVVYQDDLSPLPLYAAVFLLTMVVGSVFCYFVVPWWIEYFAIDAGAHIGTFAMVLGFLLIVVFALFILFFSTGTSLHAVTFERVEAQEPQDDVPMDREAACKALAEQYQMTQREQDVLYYISLGYNVKKIGETLFISEHTVHTHAKSVYRKLDVHAKQEVIDLVNGMCGE